jgi:galactonate dehydratase
MKITKVEPLLGQGTIVGSWVFAKVTTDEGIVGYGEGTRHAGPVIAEAISWLEPYVVGMNPFDVETIYLKMYDRTQYVWGAVFSCAISAIESALWDIMGKAVDKPVYDLLGGKVWDRVSLYTHIGGGSQINLMGVEEGIRAADDFGAIAERAKDLKNRGFSAVKTFPSGRYQSRGTTSAFTEFKPSLQMGRKVVLESAAKLEFIREQVGDEVEIAVDVHGLNVMSAVRLAKALEPFDLLWYEEPVHPFNFAALKQFRSETTIPIAMSERLHTIHEYGELLDTKAVDILMTDLQWNGGVGQTKKIAAMAEAHYIPVTLHNCNSPLATIINAHVASTMPNFINMEFMDPDVPWRDDVITEPLQVENGQLILNEKPGWGVDINEEVLAQHPYDRAGGSYEARGLNY